MHSLGKYYKVALVRNPYFRLASFWSYNQLEQGPCYRNSWRTFSDLVDYVYDTPDAIVNLHFRSMSWDLCVDGIVDADLLVRFEDLPKSWNYVRKVLLANKKIPLGSLPLTRHSGADLRWYTPNLIQAVRERYSTDMRVFGYGWPN
jgi:hypothetical protein